MITSVRQLVRQLVSGAATSATSKKKNPFPPGGDNDCDCEVIPNPKPKVTCPADFPLCKGNGDCTTHVGPHVLKGVGCTYSYVRAKCTQKFPICYKDGDCVLQACKNGVQEGTNCERWQSGHNYISLIFREGQDKTPCSDDYFPEVYYEKRGTNLDSVKGRPSGGGNPTDLVACNPGQLTSGAAVDFCKNMCSNFFNCGGFTIHGNQIMLKRIVLKEGVLDDMVFEHQDYFIDRTGFTTYYLKTPGSKIEQTTSELRELFA